MRLQHIIKSFNASSDTLDYLLEFGVFNGTSINTISSLTDNKIYGFDSFVGLPEPWLKEFKYKKGSIIITHPKGTFSVKKLPEVSENVVLVKGWFKETIPEWKKEHKNTIRFLHIDSDLYSSCKTVLTELNDQIVYGTVIAFDEMFGYVEWENHEWKALQEWCIVFNRKYEWLYFNNYQGSIRITE